MVGLFLIVFPLFACLSSFCKTEELRECIPYAGPKSIVLEDSKSRVYDKAIAKGSSCLVNDKAPYTRLYCWDSAPKADLMTAVQIAWHRLRYALAERQMTFDWQNDVVRICHGDFQEKKMAIFEYKGVSSTNLTLRVYPFKAANPCSRATDDICLVCVYDEVDFLCALYVNVNTGEVDFSFRSASSSFELVLCETHCPFLTLEEYAVQEKLFPPKQDRTKKPLKHEAHPPKPVDIKQKPVEVEVEI